MNLTISPVSFQSSRLVITKMPKIKTAPAKDVFVGTMGAIAAVSIPEAPSGQDKKALSSIYTNLNYMINNSSRRDVKDGYVTGLITDKLDCLPEGFNQKFIKDVLTCITNEAETQTNNLFTCSGCYIGTEGTFLLNTCKNLVLLAASPKRADDKEFIKNLNADVLTSKKLMQEINNGNWDAVKKIELRDNNIRL